MPDAERPKGATSIAEIDEMGPDGGQTRPDEPCTRVQQGTVSQYDLAGLQNVKTLGSSPPNEATRAK